MKGVGQSLLAGLCALLVERYAVAEMSCACGGMAVYQRQREGRTRTLFGDVAVARPYYLCAHCHQGRCPLDAELGFCAGGLSSGLSALLALLGTEFVFAYLLERLTLVHVSPNTCRKETERRGQLVAVAEQAALTAAWEAPTPQLPTVSEPLAGDCYVSMDGVMVHIEGQGWKNQWLGAIYTTKPVPSAKRPEVLEVRTQQPSFFADLGDIATFGRQLWLEAQRRGIDQAQRVVVIGDGAHWIWNLAEEHFPGATHILDWYHAATYIWQAAHALCGEGSDDANAGPGNTSICSGTDRSPPSSPTSKPQTHTRHPSTTPSPTSATTSTACAMTSTVPTAFKSVPAPSRAAVNMSLPSASNKPV